VPPDECDDRRLMRRSRATRRNLTPREIYAPETIRRVNMKYERLNVQFNLLDSKFYIFDCRPPSMRKRLV
jgi:hypothetical protein